MNSTTNLSLLKPEYSDDADISDINDNMDILDRVIGAVPNNKNLQGEVDGIDAKIGSTALPTTAQTLTGAIAEHETDLGTKLDNNQGSANSGKYMTVGSDGVIAPTALPIDDTKGVGDNGYFWSADQDEKLYGIQDDRTNELYGYVNYGYDKAFSYDKTSNINLTEIRNKNIVYIDGSQSGAYHYLKLNNSAYRSSTTAGLDGWADPSYFIPGHTYRFIVKRLSGTCTNDGVNSMPVVYAYVSGTHTTSINHTVYTNGDICISEFTADNSAYQIAMLRIVNKVFTNFVCSVEMKDMTIIETASECPITKAPVINGVIETSDDVKIFSDGADNMPMNLEVGLSHLQDLHGYDNPWIGGMGRNLLYAKNWDETITSVTYTQDGSGMVDCSGTSSSASWYRIDRGAQSGQPPLVLPSGNYIVSATGLITNTYIRVTDSTGTEQDLTQTVTSKTITSDGTNAISLNMRVQSGVAFGTSTKIYCMIRYASVSDDTWKPYSNICPITGHTATKIYQTGSDYENNNNVYNITFPTSAGTIYDGTLTVDKDGTGTLVSDWYYYSFDGTEAISASSSGANRFMRYNVKDVFPNPRTTNNSDRNSETKSSHFRISTMNSSTVGFGMGIYYSSNVLYIGTRTPDIVAGQTAEEYCAYLAEQYANGTPVTIIYKVAEPVVYYLSAPQVRTLLGFNYLWCDNAGQTINSITYPTDTKTYIDNQNADGMIAQTEASMTATKAYAEGELFTVKSKLYKATASIAIGDALVTGTNCTETTVADEISAILNSTATGVSF